MAKKQTLNSMVKGIVSPICVQTEKSEQFIIADFIEKQREFLVYKQSQNLAPRTIRDYQDIFKWMSSYIEETYSDATDRTYDITLIRGYISYLLEKVSASTVNIRLRCILVYMKFLEEERYVTERIAHRIQKVKQVVEEKKPLTDSDVKKIFKQIDLKTYIGLRDYTIALILLSVGLRANEVCNLKVSDVDLKDRSITVRNEAAKNRKQRVVLLNNKIILYIKKLIQISNDVQCEYLFLSSNTQEKVSTSQIKSRLMEYGKKAGLDKSSSLHKWRHTAVTNMVRNGVSALDVKEIAGHSSLSVTQLYYHTNLQQLHKAIEKDSLSRL